MHILVTGGAGFIGSHAADLLVRDGHQVTVLDSLVKGHVEALHPDATFVQGDCGDGELLGKIFSSKRFDAVMHFAAFIEAGESMKNPGRFFVNNTSKTLVLLDAMAAHSVRHFIFSSTAATYGDPEYSPIDEAHPQKPVNVYGYSKLLVEGALKWMSEIHGMSCVCLRYFNAAGCSEKLGEDHSPETHLIPLALDVALGKMPSLRLFGTDYPTPDGTCVRDYVHVADLADAHLLALKKISGSEAPLRLAYNLGNGRGFSVREVIETARRVTGHPIPTIEEPRRAGDPAVLVASSEKIKTELGWEPKCPSLEGIIQSAWAWRKSHPGGYGR
ncbi:MAG: UDP-glucose 4-epimerase GalE [Holophagales bacterium]|jgi:UDP-glucose 4-epimerase|nr:UDP-glucose 4-epimerase GalE [Holophagales bacterium]